MNEIHPAELPTTRSPVVESEGSDGTPDTDEPARRINSVAIVGAGTMGTGIAAVTAKAGCPVLLLDVDEAAAQRALDGVDAQDRHLVSIGTVGDRLDDIAGYDWVCEAVVEDLAVKRQLFERLEAARSDGSVISSNTSGIPLRQISEGMSERFRRDVAITHFFNPVQVMKLFELVPGDDTEPEVIEAFARFGAHRLGKGVVHAKDTVNFIGNRIGCYFMLSGLHLAKPFLAAGMTPETVDAVLGAPVGLPPTGLYGLIDLIGLDVMELVGVNLARNLPAGDRGRAFAAFPEAEQAMAARGQLGRKTGGGFGRRAKAADGTRTAETFDLVRGEWRTASPPDLDGVPTDLGEVLFAASPQGELARQVFGGTLAYAADLVPEIADDIANVDNAIRWGFNWVYGPFEMLDHVGPARVIDVLRSSGTPLPAMLATLEASGRPTFYSRSTDGTRMQLMPDGTVAPVDAQLRAEADAGLLDSTN
ncbi:3-hydroxyacyl-CoA dehydrogenase family protein [Candidatus Poriferisodalis sp.]|uniref:3-hydroxyacyl-CoA dehydrogenase family protein n=1 Tax=Candidatus Poriferisodalis sp. TaxID=3101277 RepID=UPI003B011F94